MNRYFGRFLSVLVFFWFFLRIFELRFYEDLGLYFGIVSLIIGLLCFLYLLWNASFSKIELLIISLFSLISVFPGMVSVSGENLVLQIYGLSSGLFILTAYFMAKHIVSSGHETIVAMPVFFIFIFLYCFYVFETGEVLAQGFFLDASYNLISAVIVYVTVFLISVYKDSVFKSLLPLSIAVVICFFLYARSSIAVVFMAFLWWLSFRIKIRYLFWVFVLIVLVLVFWDNGLLDLYSQTKFSSSGLDSPRWEMWRSYFQAQDWRSVLLGIDLSKVDVVSDYNNNPHNSFIRFHSLFGLLGLALLIFVLIYVAFFSPLFYKGAVFLLLIRASTDVIVMPGFLDFYFFLVLIYSVNRYKNSDLKHTD